MSNAIGTLMLLAVLVVGGAGAALWPRIRNELSLETSVERFNSAMDAMNFDEGHRQARWAVWLHPESDVAQNMLWQGRWACKIRDKLSLAEEKSPSGFVCELRDDP